MRVITLPPTNALLVAHGFQTIITRPTDTNYRGYVAIYAAKELSDLDRSLMAIYPFTDCLARVGDSRVERGWDGFWRTTRQMGWASTIESNPKYAKEIEDGLPKGAIVGVAWLAKTQNAVAAYANWNRREDVETLDDEADYNDVPRWGAELRRLLERAAGVVAHQSHAAPDADPGHADRHGHVGHRRGIGARRPSVVRRLRVPHLEAVNRTGRKPAERIRSRHVATRQPSRDHARHASEESMSRRIYL
jgi:hypothetical protein